MIRANQGRSCHVQSTRSAERCVNQEVSGSQRRIPALQRNPMRTGIRKLPIPLGSAACIAGAGRVAGTVATTFFRLCRGWSLRNADLFAANGRPWKRVVGNPSSHSDWISTLSNSSDCGGAGSPSDNSGSGVFLDATGSSGGAALNSPTGTQLCNLPSRDLTRHKPSLSPITRPIGLSRLSRTRNPRLHCVSGSALVSDGSRAKPRKAKNPKRRPMGVNAAPRSLPSRIC